MNVRRRSKFVRILVLSVFALFSTPLLMSTLLFFPACATPESKGPYQDRTWDEQYRQMKMDQAAERYNKP
jgi:hypothetical protein